MDITDESEIPLEILVSTMNRNSLDFLYNMFKNTDINKYQILIINQTSKDNLLHADASRIRIINSFEKGLSRSRNLAIKNAIGDLCLFADDDIMYLKNFEKHIIEAYNSIPDADVLTFKTQTFKNNPYSNYPIEIQELGIFYKKVLSIEVSFKRESFQSKGLTFDENFGLGSIFQDGENRILFNEIKNNRLKAYFVPEFIVIHNDFSSSDDVSSDRFIFARSALHYKLYGKYAYMYLMKLIFSIFRKRMIGFKELKSKFKTGIQGINTYKELLNE